MVMKQKHYWIIGIIIILATIGIIVILLSNQGNIEISGLKHPAYYVDVEATVISLYTGDLYSDCQEPEVCPRDRIILKIDNIDREGDPNNAMKLNIGDEIEFNLKYSARPAKLREDLAPKCGEGKILKSGSCVDEGCEGPECSISSPQYTERPAEMEGDYIIYHLPQKTENINEKILPGLEENSRIKIRIWQPVVMSKELGEYELI